MEPPGTGPPPGNQKRSNPPPSARPPQRPSEGQPRTRGAAALASRLSQPTMRTLFLLVDARADQPWGRFPHSSFNTSGPYRRFSETAVYARAARLNPGLTTRSG